LVTDVTEARPQAIQYLPGLSYLPLGAAVGTTLAAVGVLARGYSLAAFGCAFTLVALLLWARPRPRIARLLRESDLTERTGLPVLATGSLATAWWGMVGYIVIAGTVFAALMYSYFYIRLFSPEWPQDHLPAPPLGLPAAGYGMLAFAALAQAAALRAWRQDRWRATLAALGGTLLPIGLFLAFLIFQGTHLEFTLQTNAYSSLFHVITWAAALTALLGLVLTLQGLLRLAIPWAASLLARRPRPFAHPTDRAALTLVLEITSLYWWFVAAAGAAVYATLYLSPTLL
jgi:heme/copper-type cytochrome/quinol oxidase subunit 3